MKYFRTLLNEKGISLDTVLEVEGKEWGLNMIPVEVVVEFMETRDIATQKKMRDNLTKIDFMNGDVMHFITYVAKFLAK
jgi:predicted hydrocarbon binding protein